MNDTRKIVIDPQQFCAAEELFDNLLASAEFSTFPIDLIGGSLQRASAIASAIPQADPHYALTLADACQSHIETALVIALAWDRQQRASA